MVNLAVHEVLVQYPLVSEDAPEWKRTCPFCGAFEEVHNVEDTYVCHECLANWLENDTETERQIQVLYLNDGKMPRFNEGEMPLVERKLRGEAKIFAEIDLETNEVKFFNGGHGNELKLAANF